MSEVRLDHLRKHRDAVLVALPGPDDDLVGGEVHVLDATLENPQAGAIEQAGHEPRRALELLEHGADLLASQDDGQTLRTLRAHDALEPGQVQLEHVAVEKQEGA